MPDLPRLKLDGWPPPGTIIFQISHGFEEEGCNRADLRQNAITIPVVKQTLKAGLEQ